MKQPVRFLLANLRFWLVGLALLAAPFIGASQTWDQVLKAVATDAATDDQLGISVAINGDYAVVGAWMDNFPGAVDAGSAYFFQRIAGVWTFTQKVSASDRSLGDHFGFSVAINGTYAIIGAPDDDHSLGTINTGSAYVFELIAGTWTQVEKLRSSDEDFGGRFGASVSISGNYAVVGARNNDLVAGDAFVFRRNGLNDWVQMQQINSSDRAVGDQFGFSVAIDGTYIVVGSNMANIGSDDDAGAAYFFELLSGIWTEVEKVVPSEPRRRRPFWQCGRY
ncbi:MAG: FG-GAP repeat protein [Haliscomenobacter sp.]|nr:FG-GAP repeat protein [Haliscomenobacter sp.]